ncbi:MAG: hypothetical protein JSU86_04600 [Phycisphaerales bacterium]|nr:MAG: hypothetical protein JSU86_04600 [Phycisphaerales bacterium]
MVKRMAEVAVVTVAVVTVAVGRDKAGSDQKVGDATTPAKQVLHVAHGKEGQSAGKGMAVMQQAAEADKYLFVFFYKAKNKRTRRMREIFDAAMLKVADKAESIAINITDPLEKKTVNKFKTSRAPMPLVFSVAPNGAIVGSFPARFSEKQLLGAFASPSMEKCLKALQERKYVILCVQNEETHFNGEAMQGVRDFVADRQYARSTEIVKVDPRDANEADLLARFGLDSGSPDAVTVLLAPPRITVGTFQGGTDKDAFVAAITQSKSGCRCGGGLTEE